MTETVIRVDNLSKEYRLGLVGHDTLYRDLQSWWARVRGKEDPNSLLTQLTPDPSLDPSTGSGTREGKKPNSPPPPLFKREGSKASPGVNPSPQTPLPAARRKGLASPTASRSPLSHAGEGKDNELKKHFLALNDVSFEVKQGDVLGIIGRNGAGKSTLLKILSRITSPSAGEIKIKGRLASLLEVGTGFHQELTGRENVYMNGAILGMRRHEIAKKMDEIIAFSGVEKFIDTPVKRYSSGMMVRLAFSVASNLDAEILVIDEVLAVGDAEFQKKCLGKMDDVAKKQGRTVLFVSHNMGAVEKLCSTGIFLDKGKMFMNNKDLKSSIRMYHNNGKNGENWNSSKWQKDEMEIGNEFFMPLDVSCVDRLGNDLNMPISNDADFFIKIIFTVDKPDPALEVGLTVTNEEKEVIFSTQHTDKAEDLWPKIKKGKNEFRVRIPARFLNEGNYSIELSSSLYNRMWIVEYGKENICVNFSISGGMSDSPYWYAKRGGCVAPIIDWISK